MNKLSELKAAALAATPGPWMKIDYFWIGRSGAINSEFITCDNGPDADYIKRVSPDAVLALLAELEAKDKRIAGLEGDNALLTNQRDLWYGKVQDLEAKMATPVRLPGKTSDLDSWDGGWDACLEECADAIRAAGFTVEGDK